MSEDSSKPPSINLEELERQLREALSRRSAPSDPVHDGAGNEDPLSMLARLVEYEGAAKQAQAQPVAQAPAYAQPEPALHEPQIPSYPDPARQPPANWQPYEEQSPVEPAARYQTHDHLVFDPHAAGASAEPQTPEPVAPQNYAPYVPQAPAAAAYAGQLAVDYEPAPVQPDTSSYYGGASPQPAAVEPVAHAAVEAPRDYFASSQPVAAASYEPAAYEPLRSETAPHDSPALSPSEIRPVSDAEALSALYGHSRHAPAAAAEPVAEQPVHSPYAPQSYASQAYAPQASDQRSAADRALVYAAAFPDKTQPNQWNPDAAQGVGLSYSEAEANLGAEQRPAEPQQKSQGKGLMILLGLVVVMAGGFGLAAYLRNEGARVPSGAPPVISADKTPVKVVPTNPGGTEVPNQGAAIYQPSKPEDAKDAKVVSTDEKPVDISAAPRPPGSPLIGEPKKIRTVTVRPDGTLVEENTVAAGSPVPNAAAAPRAAPSMVTIQPPVATPSAPVPAAAPAANPPAAQGTAAQVTANAGGVRVMPPTRPQGAEQTAAPAAAPAASPPARATTPAPAAPAVAETAERTPTGDYGVQFSAPATEGEARNAIVALKRSYANILDGMTLAAQKAENGGRTIFRVRAVGLSREEAISVCEKIKATGGQCFVARN